MARKKTKKVNISQQAMDQARREAMGNGGVDTAAPQFSKSGKVEAAQVQKSSVADLAAEYVYVINDLRNMGILAAVLFAILIAMSFII